MVTFIQLTMALHQRQRQSCKRRTLPQVLSHTVHLALTGRFPSNHWCGIEICKWDRGRGVNEYGLSIMQFKVTGYIVAFRYIQLKSLYMHSLRTAKVISRKHLIIFFGSSQHARTQRDQVIYPRLLRKQRLASDIPYAKIFIIYLSFAKNQTRFPMPPTI